jgi:hypothetical protein
MDGPWFVWLYQYGIGGAVFSFSLFVAFRTGAVRWHNVKNRILVISMILGLLLFAATHAAWISILTG